MILCFKRTDRDIDREENARVVLLWRSGSPTSCFCSNLDAAGASGFYSPSLWSWFSFPLASSWRRCTEPEPRHRAEHRRWRWPRLRPLPRPLCPWWSAASPPISPPPGESRPASCQQAASYWCKPRSQRSSVQNKTCHSLKTHQPTRVFVTGQKYWQHILRFRLTTKRTSYNNLMHFTLFEPNLNLQHEFLSNNAQKSKVVM